MAEIRPADRRDIAALIELLAAQLSGHGLAAGPERVRRGIEVAFDLVAMEGSRAVGALTHLSGRCRRSRAGSGHSPPSRA